MHPQIGNIEERALEPKIMCFFPQHTRQGPENHAVLLDKNLSFQQGQKFTKLVHFLASEKTLSWLNGSNEISGKCERKLKGNTYIYVYISVY